MECAASPRDSPMPWLLSLLAVAGVLAFFAAGALQGSRRAACRYGLPSATCRPPVCPRFSSCRCRVAAPFAPHHAPPTAAPCRSLFPVVSIPTTIALLCAPAALGACGGAACSLPPTGTARPLPRTACRCGRSCRNRRFPRRHHITASSSGRILRFRRRPSSCAAGRTIPSTCGFVRPYRLETRLPGTKAFRVRKKLGGGGFFVVITFCVAKNTGVRERAGHNPT